MIVTVTPSRFYILLTVAAEARRGTRLKIAQVQTNAEVTKMVTDPWGMFLSPRIEST